jgi:CBS domain-containing protein
MTVIIAIRTRHTGAAGSKTPCETRRDTRPREAAAMLNRPLSELLRGQTAPLTLPPGATVREACLRMRECAADAVLVADGAGRLLGIFTGRDAVRRVLAETRDADRATLAEVMTQAPATVPARAAAMEALRLMRDGGFDHVPVVEAGRVVGLVSHSHFLGLEQTRLEEETWTFETLR